ncbi:MAG: tetratricopeptide repeat protein [Chromatiales bacterium]|nr:tetratricopeptide repeat protein [Chromatiales bacterium]
MSELNAGPVRVFAAGMTGTVYSISTPMMTNRLLPIAMLFVLLLGMRAGEAADYRALDAEVRAVQRVFAAAGGAVSSQTAVLLSVDPAHINDAEEVLARAASSGSLLPDSRDAELLWLAKRWMARAYLNEAATLLARVRGNGDVGSEKILLQAEILARQGRHADAAALLQSAQAQMPQPWASYAAYNLAAASLSAGRTQAALETLDALGRGTGGDDEVLALRDRANITLGFQRLGAGDGAAAKAAFDRVRFDGPFSAEALFGLGWSEFSQNNLSRALIPWAELNQRGALEPAVREVLLLAPYARWQLGAYREAVEQYRTAITRFDAELALLDRTRAGLGGDALLDTLSITAQGDGAPRPPAGYDSFYLRALMSAEPFRAGLDTLRHLREIEREAVSLPGGSAIATRANAAAAGYRELLRAYADADLGAERERSVSYRARAHFELARLLDEVSARENQQEGAK